jgi:hypothetical protein
MPPPTEHRINLTAAEVRAYQAGETTLRRRVRPEPYCPNGWWHDYGSEWCYTPRYANVPDGTSRLYRSPFGQPGEVLVIAERHLRVPSEYEVAASNSIPTVKGYTIYAADCPKSPWERWQPASKMEREDIRHTARVVSVTVELIDGVWWWVAGVTPCA